MVAGLMFITVLVLPLTRVPWQWFGALANPGVKAQKTPTVLVLMGGGGIPSETGLVRSWITADAAKKYPSARVIVAMPLEPEEKLPGLMEQELILRGVSASRLQREPKGRNTREQALEVFTLIGGDNAVVGLVTSPEHMARTWHAFRKAGFTRLVAFPGWAQPLKADGHYNEGDLGGISLGGLVGGNDMVKYRYWDNLGILVKCARETVALGYYRLMGWI